MPILQTTADPPQAALVKGSGLKADESGEKMPSGTADSAIGSQLLSEEEVLGNSFIFVLAGHETTAATLHMALVFLACDPSSQIGLQEQLDGLFADRPRAVWDYEKDCPKLLEGMAGAILHETLRMVPPVVIIPKTTRSQAQPLVIRDQRVVVPSDTVVRLHVVAAHRNTKAWPPGPPTPSSSTTTVEETTEEDLAQFKPRRWFQHNSDESKGEPVGRLPGTLPYRPPRGAFLAFSEGHRACLGRRFAQVEVVAALATIFREHSVELSVDQYAHPSDLRNMDVGGGERRAVWCQARAKVDWMLKNGMKQRVTLKMQDRIALKIVKRGHELFRGQGYGWR